MIYGETGRLPIAITIKTRMICFWHKISCKYNTNLSNTLYKVLYELNNKELYKSKWLTYIKNILIECGLPYIFNNPSSVSSLQLKNIIKKSLSDQYIQNWNSAVNQLTSCINYKIFKTCFISEPYLTFLPNHLMHSFCRFRLRNFKLPITLNMFNRNHPKLCSLCETNKIGDELHYLLECPYFKESRKDHIKKHFYTHPNTLKFQSLLSAKSPKMIYKVASFCHKIEKHFNSTYN